MKCGVAAARALGSKLGRPKMPKSCRSTMTREGRSAQDNLLMFRKLVKSLFWIVLEHVGF